MSKYNLLIILLSIILLNACRSKKEITRKQLKKRNTSYLIEELKKNEFNCDRLSLKANVHFKVDKQEDSFKMYIRLRKDSAIWLSATYFSLEAVRLLITPDSVKYLDRKNKTYFIGDVDYINEKFDLDVDFYSLQALLMGNSVGIDKKDKTKSFIDNGFYHLTSIKAKKYRRSINKPQKGARDIAYGIWLDPKTYKVAKIRIHDFKYDKSMVASFLDHEKHNGQLFPKNIDIVVESNKLLILNIEYSKLTVNEPVKMPFKIPSKYIQTY